MARDTLSVYNIGREGAQYTADITYTAFVAANDMEVANDGNVMLLIENTGTSGAQTISIIGVACSHGRIYSMDVVVGQADTKIVGPFPPSQWNQSDGMLDIDGADEDLMKLCAFRLNG